jgi:hypothetical protein
MAGHTSQQETGPSCKMPAPKSDGPTSVYIIACGGYIKVGLSNDPKRRLQDMRTSMPGRPRLIETRTLSCRADAKWIEGMVHWKLMPYRLRPRGEWFKAPHDVAIAELHKAELQKFPAHAIRPSRSLVPEGERYE